MERKYDKKMNHTKNTRIYSLRYEIRKKIRMYPAHTMGLNRFEIMFINTTKI
jgi:hypothetical protein